MSSTRPQRHWLVDQLPQSLATDPFLRSFSLIFEDIVDSVRAPVLGFDNYLDTAVAPPEFVRWMAQWVGLNLDASLAEERQRSALRAAGALLPWRGTKRGLQGLLTGLVGAEVEVLDRGGVFLEENIPEYDPRVTVRLPHAVAISEHQLRMIIEAELPAGLELELVIGNEEAA